MIRLERIVLREIRLPLKEPFVTSAGTVYNRRILLAEVGDSDGIATWSECVAGEYPNYTSETIDTALLAIEQWIAPLVQGCNMSSPKQFFPLVNRDIKGHLMAKATLEMAVWSLFAEKEGKSLATYIGGTRKKVATGISLGVQSDPSILVERVQDSLEAGYRRIKVKIKPGADLKPIEAVRSAVGDQVPLAVDGNNAYSLDDMEVLTVLDKFDLMMMEQPLAWNDHVRHAALQRLINTPICLDESIESVSDSEDMVSLGSGRIINLKPGRVGGYFPAIAIHDFCSKNGIPVWCGGMLESGIGRAYNVALAALPNFSLPGDLSPSARYWRQDVVDPEWIMEDGLLRVPFERSGIGVSVDVDRIESLTVKKRVIMANGVSSHRAML